MTFRRNNKTFETQWLKRNRYRLLDCGIPECIVMSERNWNYVLLHGDDELQSGWNVKSLSLQDVKVS